MPTNRGRPLGLWIHAAVVAAFVILFLAMALAFSDGIGANIGAGIALLPVLALGLPWTLPMIIDPYAFDSWPRPIWYLVAVGPAVLNVLLHAALVARRRRTA